jgi:Legume lectin domain/Bacterial Ig-like domain (group 3)
MFEDQEIILKPFSAVYDRAVCVGNSHSVIWLIFPLLVTFVARSSSSIAQSTNIAIETTVQRSPVKRLGVNLGGQTFYDSGQIMRNLIFRNPGFEGETWQSVLHCVSVTAGSCTDANVYNVWPVNFLQGASYEFLNGAALGETGTITSNTVSAYIAGSSNPNYGLTINFPPPTIAPQVGDYVIARMQVPGNAQAGWWTVTSGGATLSTDFSDLAPGSPGKQALEMNAAGSGQSASIVSYFDTYAGRSFVQMNGAYTLAFKAKGKAGSKQLTFSVQRLGTAAHGNETLLNQSITLGSNWQDYSFSFNASEDGTYIGNAQVAFVVAGSDIYIDDATLMSPAAPNNPTAFRNEVVDALRGLRPGVIRYMTGTDFGSSTANIVAPPFARQRAGINSQASEEDDVPMGLEEFLVLCQTIGAEPWYTMAGEATPEDMQNLIEFLGGAATTPYGAKRAALGQSAPWTTVFPVIHLELGNEMWNWSMTGEAISDPVVYGHRAGKLFAAARSSASYNPSKFDLIMGSFAVNSWWTQQEMINGSGYDSVDAAPYLFNTFNDHSSNENIFGPMFAQPEQIDSNSTGYMSQQQQAAAGGTPPAKLAVYEVNLSTLSGTAPQSPVNQTAGGVAAGITVAEHMLLMMRDLGITTQNMFGLSGFVAGFSNPSVSGETAPLWGSVIDMGGETNVHRPIYIAEQLVNSAILPTMLATNLTGANPTWNQPLSTNDNIQLADAHYLQSFAFTDGTNKSVIVFNLSRSGSLPITFSGANAPTGNVLISQLTSKNITDNNEGLTSDNPVVVPTRVDVSNFNPATAYSLPPYSMTVFLWPGATLPASTTNLEASPTSGAVGQTIMLTAAVDSESGTNIPTGQVTFLNGSSSLDTATLNSSGVATYSTSSLPAGSDQISASYSGDAEDAGSTSPIVTVRLTSGTATSLTTSATQVTPGQSVTLTAKVAPLSGNNVPTGTVTFQDGTTILGTASLNSSGIASLTTSSFATGSNSITASYGGDSNDSNSLSRAVDVIVTASSSATVNFGSGFAQSASQIKLNGNAAISGSSLQLANGGLNQAGSAFYATPLNIAAFTTDFRFQLVDAQADGFAFVIQNDGPTALGVNGGGLGYWEIPNSVAIKFDLYNNAGEGSDSTGLYTDGVTPTVPAINLSSTPINLHSGDPFAAHVSYDGTDLTLTLTDSNTLGKWSYSWPINIPATVGGTTAYVGFTGATGGFTATQDINTWTYFPALTVPNFPAGFDRAGLQLNGASYSGTSLQLTTGGLNQTGSAFYATPVNIAAFTTDFSFQLVDAQADGFTFVLQNAGPTALGTSGGGLGYSGIPNSVAIKFDLYNNAGEGPDSTGLFTDGSASTVPAINLTGTPINLHSGDPFAAHVTYDGTDLTLNLTDSSTLGTWSYSWPINIPATVGGTTAYAGFTGATGGLTSTQNINTWSFSPPQ